MISRCPKIRASSEYAPGPSSATAPVMQTTNTIVSKALRRLTAGAGRNANATPSDTAFSTAAIGVKNPAKSARPQPTSIAAATQLPMEMSALPVR